MHESPYVLSNWVQGDGFYGRGELCRALSTTPDRCVYLAGTRRIGKTSLLLRLASELQPHAIYCDLMRAAGADSLDEARLVTLMRRQLAAQAAESPALQESRPAWDQSSASLCGWLEEASWHWEQQGLTITLLWDEAELLRRLPNSTLMPLRAILQHGPGLRVILAASKGLADLNDRWRGDYVSPFLFGFRTYYLASLTDAEAAELIQQRGRIEAAPSTIEAIRAWTGNHPFLLQYLCDTLYGDGRLRHPDERDLVVDTALADLLRIDVSYLSPGEHAILSALVARGPLDQAALAVQVRLADDVAHSFAVGLRQLGLIRARPDGCWEIGNAFLAQWLRTQHLHVAPTLTDRASLEVIDPAGQRQVREQLGASSAAVPGAALSERERAVLRLVAAGMTNPEIARELSIALDTVKAHLKHVASKLDASNRAQAVARAKELGLI